MNPHETLSQFDTAVVAAVSRVRTEGIDDASDRDITLMGFGAVIEELHELGSTLNRTNGTGRMAAVKRQAPTAVGGGGFVGMIILLLERLL